jgi:ABC-type oligopeptide transport system substrate-binding subunit
MRRTGKVKTAREAVKVAKEERNMLKRVETAGKALPRTQMSTVVMIPLTELNKIWVRDPKEKELIIKARDFITQKMP